MGFHGAKTAPHPMHTPSETMKVRRATPSRALLRGFDSMRDAGTRPAFAFGKRTGRLELYKGRTAREKTQRQRRKTCLPWRRECGAAVRMIAEGHCGDACVYTKYPRLSRRCLFGKAALIQEGERGCSSSRFLRRINARKAECCLAAGKQYVCVL